MDLQPRYLQMRSKRMDASTTGRQLLLLAQSSPSHSSHAPRAVHTRHTHHRRRQHPGHAPSSPGLRLEKIHARHILSVEFLNALPQCLAQGPRSTPVNLGQCLASMPCTHTSITGNRPRSTPVNRGQPRSTLVNLGQRRSTVVILGQRLSTSVKTDRPRSTPVKPSRPQNPTHRQPTPTPGTLSRASIDRDHVV